MKTSTFNNHMVTSDRIIYTPSVFAKESLTHLQEIGSLAARMPHTSSRDHLISYLFFFIRSGSGSLEYGGRSYHLQKGDCVFIDCRQSYAHRTDHDLWELSWIHFNGPTMPQIYEKYLERGGLPTFHPNSEEPYLHLFEKLYQLADSEEYVRDMKINEHLMSLLTLLMEESWHPDTVASKTIKRQSLLEVRKYLDAHFTEKITLDELASRFYLNKYYLTHIYKEQYGISINTYLQQLRITQAKHMLRFTDQSMDQIGLACGIGDANYFARLFKKVEGISPGEFRRMW